MKLSAKIQARVKPLFLLGSNPSFLREDKLGYLIVHDESEQETRMEEILHQLGFRTETKTVIRKEEDLQTLDLNADVFLLFVHSAEKYPYLAILARSGKPIVLCCEEGAISDLLDVYGFMSDNNNIKMAVTFEEIRRIIRAIKAVRYVNEARICLFDSGARELDGSSYHSNPVLDGRLRTQLVNMAEFEANFRSVDRGEAENLARDWMKESRVIEPSLEDVTNSVAIYLTLKKSIEKMNADAAYILWCAQFNKIIGGKMCLAVGKLNDDGCLTGCWRGENMLPTMILHALSEKPVFFGEVHTFRNNVLSVRHCAVAPSMASSPLVLRNWRNQAGTVTGYAEMPRGKVTILNAGNGDKMVAVKGEVIESRDIGGDNCRTTVFIRIEGEKPVREFRGAEMAMAYGDYLPDIQEVGQILGISVNQSLQ